MSQATHWLEFDSVPVLITPNSSTTKPLTQAAILLEKGGATRRRLPVLYQSEARPGRSLVHTRTASDRGRSS